MKFLTLLKAWKGVTHNHLSVLCSLRFDLNRVE